MASKIHKALSRALAGGHTRRLPLKLDEAHRYVILSDQHKGAGDQADEFATCRPAYRAALLHYLRDGFTLILLGDVEELWENTFREVFAQHGDLIDLESAFGEERYYRVWGNHDDAWRSPARVRRDLEPRLPRDSGVVEGLRFEVTRQDTLVGTLIILHGHQGTLDSDRLAWLARPALRYVYRPIMQNFFGIGRQTPSTDARLRGKHDREMYEWAAGQPKLILIAGHTHRPVWAALTHLQRLEREIADLRRAPQSGNPEWEARLAHAEELAARKRAESPPQLDMKDEDLVPCYVNTGCCKFSDGDITGIEIVGGEVRLVKWSDPSIIDPPGPQLLEAGLLTNFFRAL